MGIDGKEYLVRDLMRPVVVLKDSIDLKEALAQLVKERSNIAGVVDDNGSFIGAVSTVSIIRAVLPDYMEADIVAAKFADDKLLKEDALRAAGKLLHEFVHTTEDVVKPDDNLLSATVTSAGHGTGRIFVLDEDGKPVGLLTRTEIKQVLAAFLGVNPELHEKCKHD